MGMSNRIVYQSAQFVDRTEEISRVVQSINLLVDGKKPRERVWHILGNSYSGKTWFLKQLSEEITKITTSSATVRVRPTGTLTHRREVVCFPFALKEPEYQNPDVKKAVVLLLTRFANLILQMDNHPTLVPGRNTPHQIGQLIRDHLKSWAEQNHRILVLLLDDIDRASEVFLEELEDHLLSICCIQPNTLICIAGRSSGYHWKNFSMRPRESGTIRLSCFLEKDTRDQLEAQFPSCSGLAADVHRISGGTPGYNMLVAQNLENTPPDSIDVEQEKNLTENIVQEMLAEACKQFTNVELLEVLEALSVLRGFSGDHNEIIPLLDAYMEGISSEKRWTENDWQDLFLQLGEAQLGAGKLVTWDKKERVYCIDEPIRKMMERRLQLRDPALRQKLHCTAAEMYSVWGKLEPHWQKKAEFHQEFCKKS